MLTPRALLGVANGSSISWSRRDKIGGWIPFAIFLFCVKTVFSALGSRPMQQEPPSPLPFSHAAPSSWPAIAAAAAPRVPSRPPAPLKFSRGLSVRAAASSLSFSCCCFLFFCSASVILLPRDTGVVIRSASCSKVSCSGETMYLSLQRPPPLLLLLLPLSSRSMRTNPMKCSNEYLARSLSCLRGPECSQPAAVLPAVAVNLRQ